MIETGIYNNLSSEDYHNDKNSLSRSSLRDFYKSPHFYYSMHLSAARPVRNETPDMRFGKAFHTLILETDKFEEQYETEPEKVLLKDVGRKAYDEHKEKLKELEESNKIILSYDEMRALHEMSMALLKNEKAKELIANAIVERSFFWDDPITGIRLKARPDVLQHNMIIDLKTVSDASVRAFQNSMVTYWNHVQGAMVRDALRILQGENICNVINIVIEKKYPYSVGIYIIDEATLDYAEQLYKGLLNDLKACIDNQDFRDLEVQTVGLPKWAIV